MTPNLNTIESDRERQTDRQKERQTDRWRETDRKRDTQLVRESRETRGKTESTSESFELRMDIRRTRQHTKKTKYLEKIISFE